MRIAGIYYYDTNLDPKIQHAVSEPYGLEKILAMAQSEGHEVDLFLPITEKEGKIIALGEEELVDKITEFKPDLACFSIYTCQYPTAKSLAARLKTRIPHLKVIAGNRYPTFLKEKIEAPFDVFIVKEGELTFRELLKQMESSGAESSGNFTKVKGISFRKNGSSIFTGIRERNFELDSLPNALRSPLLLKQPYQGISIPPLSSNPRYALTEYSRCCYNACKFCDNVGFWGNKLAFRSPEKVVNELMELKDKGVDIVYFIDLNFTAIPQKAIQLCREIITRGLKLSWYCMSNVSTADSKEEIFSALKEAGGYKIAWGIESTDDKSLEKMGKKTGKNLLKNEKSIAVLQKSLGAGLINQGYYIIGFPWETEESILRDAERLKHLPLHQLNIGVFTPTPLSPFYEKMVREGYTFNPDLKKHDRNHLVYSHQSLTDGSIKKIQQKIHDEFYESPEFRERVKASCKTDPRFQSAFNDYFQFLGKGGRV